jgi:hypothetical protein
MDIMLFALCLLTFACCYLALTIYLFWTLVITMLVIITFLAIRWRSVAENYPYGINDSIVLLALVSVTWVLFVFLGPKDPVPFLGGFNGPNGLTYGSPPWGVVTAIAIIFIFLILIIMAILIHYLQGRLGSPGGGGDDGGRAKVGVGA